MRIDTTSLLNLILMMFLSGRLAAAAARAGPHVSLLTSTSSAKEELLANLLDRLWMKYRERVEVVRECESILFQDNNNNNGNSPTRTFTDDHLAFRSYDMSTLGKIFEALGYNAQGWYHFPKKRLTAAHYEHMSNPNMPKIFLSQLRLFEFPKEVRDIIQTLHSTAREEHSLRNKKFDNVEFLARLHSDPSNDMVDDLLEFFHELPWPPPTEEQVLELNKHSQYAAWVALYGNNVNHFTALVEDIDQVYSLLGKAGIPLKKTIEGVVGSKLRQTSTTASTLEAPVSNGTLVWPYAYFEFAERPPREDGSTYQGFLGPQAAGLFEMTTASTSTAATSTSSTTEIRSNEL